MANMQLRYDNSGEKMKVILQIEDNTAEYDYNPNLCTAEMGLQDCIRAFGKRIDSIGYAFNDEVKRTLEFELRQLFIDFEKAYDKEHGDRKLDQRNVPHNRVHNGINEHSIVEKMLHGEYSIVSYPVDTCFECIDRGVQVIIPGSVMPREQRRRIPKNISFQSADGTKYYGAIEKITVVDKNNLEAISSLSVGTVGVAFYSSRHRKAVVFSIGFINKDTNDFDNQILYKSKSFDTYGVLDELGNPSGVILYDLDKCQIDTESTSPVAAELAPYLKYYNMQLGELNAEEDSVSVEVDLDLLRGYYNEFKNLTIDDTQMVLPITGKVDRIKSLAIKVFEYENQRPQIFDFYEGKVLYVGRDDYVSHIEALEDSRVSIKQNQALCVLDMVGMGDKEIYQINRLFLDERIEKLYLINNIIGDRVRVGRIINGITNAITGNVVNPRLVESVCKNATGDIRRKKYTPNTGYVNYLKSTYPRLENNIEQLVAIDKIVQMDASDVDVMLVQGPPGTGKTELILSLARELTLKGYKSLITSNVHVACDNVVERLRNHKDIVLKRYTSLFGEQYEQDLLENKRRYVENQVLAGFQYGDISINSSEAVDNLSAKRDMLKTKAVIIEENRTRYNDVMAQYNALKANEKKCQSIVQNKESELNAVQSAILKNAQTVVDAEKQIEQYNVDRVIILDDERNYIQDLDEKQTVYAAKQQMLKSIYATSKDLADELNHLLERKSGLDASLDALRYEESTLTEAVSFFRENSFDSLPILIADRICDDESASNAFVNAAFNWVKKILSPYKAIHDAVMNSQNQKLEITDTDLVLKVSSILGEKENQEDLRLFLQDEAFSCYKQACSFVVLNGVKKTMMSAFPFIKEDGYGYEDLQNAGDAFCDSINESSSKYKDNIVIYLEHTVDEHFVDSTVSELIGKLTKTQTIKSEIEVSLSQVLGDISYTNESIATNKEMIGTLTKELFDLGTVINECKKRVDEIKQKQAVLDGKEGALNKQIEEINKKSTTLNEKNENAVKARDEAVEVYNKAKSATAELYSANVDLIVNYSAYVGRLQTDAKDVAIEIAEIDNAIDNISWRIDELVKSGWSKPDAQKLIYSYVSELDDVKNSEGAQSKYYFEGKGTAFENMFNLYDNTGGSLISMTTNQVASLLKNSRDLTFDFVIVDEASKCNFEDLIISLPRMKHLVLIGDFMQLDPMYDRFIDLSPEYQAMFTPSQWEALNRSSFSMLFEQYVAHNEEKSIEDFNDNPYVSILKRQYRMNKGIFNIIAPVYSIHKGFELIDAKQRTYNDIMCVDIDGEEEQFEGETSFRNTKEADAIVDLVKGILARRAEYPQIESIGIISGYKAQENYIKRELRKDKDFYKKAKAAKLIIAIGTFDRFQGREYDLVLVSLVRSKKFGFTDNVRRMNVAFSRAMKHLLVFGNYTALNDIAKKRQNYDYNAFSDVEKKEKEFVSHVLVPMLYDQKKEFVSAEECKNAMMRYIREPNYE